MAESSNDRNLLVGILALQMDFVTQEQLIQVMQAWMLNKSAPLEQILVDQQMISRETGDFLSGIANSHLRLHSNQVEKSLAALSSLSSVRKRLAELKDSDVDATLVQAEEIRLAEAKTRRIDSHSDSSSETVLDRPSDGSARFRVLRPHARGGLGIVSVAEDTELNREVALKEIQEPHATDSGSRTRFLMEAEVTGRLEHPGIVPVYSLGKTSAGNPFYVMRFIRGDSLKDAIASLHGSKRTPDEFLSILRKLVRRLVDVCNAIEYAHSRGVLHRDLKPGNIMLGKYGETLVVDWGLAKAVGRRSAANSDEATFIPRSGEGSTETRMGSVVGTLAFMSPEQASGQLDALGPRSDVYCLGATLYAMLTGQAPIEKGSTEEMLAAIRAGRIRPVRDVNPLADQAVAAICHKALSVNPDGRYPSAASMAEDLELWLTDQPVGAWQEPILRRASRWIRKHQTIAASSALMATTAIIALVFINNLTRKQNIELRQARDAEQQSRERAEIRLKTTKEVARDLVDVAEQILSQTDAAKAVRQDVMDNAFNLFRDVYREDPGDRDNAMLFAKIARIAGNQKQSIQKLDEADERLTAAEEVLRQLMKEEPENADYPIVLGELLRDVSRLRRLQDRLTDSVTALSDAKTTLTGIRNLSAEQKVAVPKILAFISNTEISLRQDLGEYELALKLADESSKTFKAYLQSGKPHPNDQQFLFFGLYRRGRILDLMGRTDDSVKAFDEALAEFHSVRSVYGTKSYSVELVRTLIWSAQARSRGTTLLPNAQEQVAEAKLLLEPMVKKPTASPAVFLYWADLNKVAGQVELVASHLDAAEAALNTAIETAEKLVADKDASYNNATLGESLAILSRLERARGNTEKSEELHRRAVTTVEKACRQLPESVELKDLLNRIHLTR